MEVGRLPGSGLGKLKQYEGHLTLYLFFVSLVAASGGLIFGYDLGISGGVSSMPDFLEKFFPDVYRKQTNTKTNNYCLYDSQTLQLFTSSLYLSGTFAAILGSYITSRAGRKSTIFLAGVSCLCGGVIDGAAQNLSMLIIGRILLGIAVGFAFQAVPLYVSEMALPKWRGVLNLMTQSAIVTGILIASLINYGTRKVNPNGWRISLGLAAFPGLLLALGSLFLPETPTSLVERGHAAKGRDILQKIRGVTTVDVEFEDLVEASNIARSVKSPWRNLLQRRYRPQLVMAVLLPAFQGLTSNTALLFYTPVLLKSIGFSSSTALSLTTILGGIQVPVMWLSMFIVDRWGRKILFYEGGVQMAACQIAIGIVLKVKLGLHNSLDNQPGVAVVVLIYLFVTAFDLSWAPLAWLVPSEIFPLEVRSAGQGLTVLMNFLFVFIIAQIYLTLFCDLRAGTFFFFAGWIVVMTIFVALLLPETKSIPLEEMVYVWRKHWFWRRYVGASDDLDTTLAKPHHNANSTSA